MGETVVTREGLARITRRPRGCWEGWLGRVRGRPWGRELRPLTTDTGAAIIDSPAVPRRFGVSVSELGPGAVRAVEGELRRLGVCGVRAPMLGLERPPEAATLVALGNELYKPPRRHHARCGFSRLLDS